MSALRIGFGTFVLGLAPLHAAAANLIPDVPAISSKGFILMDADTRHVIAERDSDTPLPPASLTKIMTSYVAAGELAAGRVRLDDEVPISVKAWRTGGSKTFVREGTKVRLEDLLRGIVIQSGNDASVALAEFLGGDEDGFANMMNTHAEEIGLTASHFVNATGLPDDDHYSSARDLAILAIELIRRYPEHYAMYSEKSFEYGGIKQPNRNRLLWRDKTADGVKTGLTDAAGYCLVASALRDGTRFVAVTMGAETDNARFRDAQKLLAYGFRYFENQEIYAAGEVLTTRPVWYGKTESVAATVTEPVRITMPRGRRDDLKAEVDLPADLEAPIGAGEQIGLVRVSLDGEALVEVPLLAAAAVEEAGAFAKVGDWFYLLFRDLLGLSDEPNDSDDPDAENAEETEVPSKDDDLAADS